MQNTFPVLLCCFRNLLLTLFQLCVSKIFTQKTAYFTVPLIIFLHDSLIVNVVQCPLFFCFFLVLLFCRSYHLLAIASKDVRIMMLKPYR